MIQTILRSSHEWGWLDTVPPIKRQKEPQKRIRWLTHEEASRLLKELAGHQKNLAAFALATGLRQRNILGLEWSQVDMVRELCWIHPDQAKGGKAIGVPLNRTAMELLTRQKGKHETRVFAFNGKPIGQVNTEAWRKALKREGISDFRWHDLRHTWASWHVQAGTPLHVLQEWGGPISRWSRDMPTWRRSICPGLWKVQKMSKLQHRHDLESSKMERDMGFEPTTFSLGS